MDLDEVAHYEPPHQDLHCLQIKLFLSLILKWLTLSGLETSFGNMWKPFKTPQNGASEQGLDSLFTGTSRQNTIKMTTRNPLNLKWTHPNFCDGLASLLFHLVWCMTFAFAVCLLCHLLASYAIYYFCHWN